MNAIKFKSDLALMQAKNIEITHCEDDLKDFNGAFAKNDDLTSRRFQTAIYENDKSIVYLKKTKGALLGADRNPWLANDKAQNVFLNTRDSPASP